MPSNVTDLLVTVGLSISLAAGSVALVVQVKNYCSQSVSSYVSHAQQEITRQ